MSDIERCWVCRNPSEPDSDPVMMWDEASAAYYRRGGWNVVEFVPATYTPGAVDALKEIGLPEYDRMRTPRRVALEALRAMGVYPSTDSGGR